MLTSASSPVLAHSPYLPLHPERRDGLGKNGMQLSCREKQDLGGNEHFPSQQSVTLMIINISLKCLLYWGPRTMLKTKKKGKINKYSIYRKYTKNSVADEITNRILKVNLSVCLFALTQRSSTLTLIWWNTDVEFVQGSLTCSS